MNDRVNVRATALTVARQATIRKNFDLKSDAKAVEEALFVMDILGRVRAGEVGAFAALNIISINYDIPTLDPDRFDFTKPPVNTLVPATYIDTDTAAAEIPEFKRVKRNPELKRRMNAAYGESVIKRIGERGRK